MKHFNYSINGNDYEVAIENVNELTANVKVNGVSYSVKRDKPSVQSSIPVKEEKPVAAKTPKTAEVNVDFVLSASGAALKSPLPGSILDIKCKIGDAVKVGQPVLILEAMKMENQIAADRDGVITAISVVKGQTVLEGEDLVIIA
jgi:biotin carboxyl carrier protein